ncbi:MAG: hypothetical protein ACP5UV_04370, partial [Thermoplasmata archaeon]
GIIEGEDIIKKGNGCHDILINCTPIGMYPDRNSPFQPDEIKEGAVGIDAVYNPIDTPFLRMVRNAGGKPVSGLGLYEGQAEETFRLIFGRKSIVNVFDIAAEAVDEADRS